MRIYAASDLHGNLPDFPPDADIVILAGDICPDFHPPRGTPTYLAQQAHWLDTTFREWLKTAPEGAPVYGIWGNHDFIGERKDLVPSGLQWALLQDELAMPILWGGRADPLRRLHIFGTPWVPGLSRWAFYGTDEFLRRRAEVMPEGLDILISHGPPHGAGDYIPGGTEKQASKYGNLHGIRVGDTWLREVTHGPKAPKVLICGHIHDDRGVHVSGNTTVYNVAAVDANYNLLPNPWTRIFIEES